jgi:hypothetical protein
MALRLLCADACRNLNFNMIGGNLSALAELPDIFPNLRHLG